MKELVGDNNMNMYQEIYYLTEQYEVCQEAKVLEAIKDKICNLISKIRKGISSNSKKKSLKANNPVVDYDSHTVKFYSHKDIETILKANEILQKYCKDLINILEKGSNDCSKEREVAKDIFDNSIKELGLDNFNDIINFEPSENISLDCFDNNSNAYKEFQTSLNNTVLKTLRDSIDNKYDKLFIELEDAVDGFDASDVRVLNKMSLDMSYMYTYVKNLNKMYDNIHNLNGLICNAFNPVEVNEQVLTEANILGIIKNIIKFINETIKEIIKDLKSLFNFKSKDDRNIKNNIHKCKGSVTAIIKYFKTINPEFDENKFRTLYVDKSGMYLRRELLDVLPKLNKKINTTYIKNNIDTEYGVLIKKTSQAIGDNYTLAKIRNDDFKKTKEAIAKVFGVTGGEDTVILQNIASKINSDDIKSKITIKNGEDYAHFVAVNEKITNFKDDENVKKAISYAEEMKRLCERELSSIENQKASGISQDRFKEMLSLLNLLRRIESVIKNKLYSLNDSRYSAIVQIHKQLYNNMRSKRSVTVEYFKEVGIL